MHGSHRGRTLTHGGRHSLGGSRSQVADGEEAGMAGLERQRRPGQRLPIVAELLGGQREVGQHEASVIKGGAAVEPTRGRVRSDEGEQSGAREDDRAVGAIELHRS